METELNEHETMTTGEFQQESTETKVMEDETMTTGENEKEPIPTEEIQTKTMETDFVQNETMETEVMQNGTMATSDQEEELLSDINANTVNNETIETQTTPKKAIVTKIKEAVSQDTLATEVSENGIDKDNNDNIRTENGDVTMESENAEKSTKDSAAIETANANDIAMET